MVTVTRIACIGRVIEWYKRVGRMMPESILSAEHLVQSYTIGDRQVKVLDDVSLAIGPGEFVVLAGRSGSGKTSLLSLLGGIERPFSGRVVLDGLEISACSEKQLAQVRNERIGFVFQAFHLVPSLNTLENVMFPAELRKDTMARDKAEQLLMAVGLRERSTSFPHQLSGGEKQRVALCRALINRPAILFADEPTGNLDSENSATIMDLLQNLRRERGAALVMATHSMEIASQADRIIRLADGRICGEELLRA